MAGRVFGVTILGVLAGIFATMAEANVPDGNALVKKSVRALRGDSDDAVYVMRLIGQKKNDQGVSQPVEESIRRMRVWFKSKNEDDAKLLIKFKEPSNIRGTGLLTLFEAGKTLDQWLFLPAYKKTRRVKGGNENESFLGSDFSMSDISVKPESSMTFKVEGTKKCGENDCHFLVGTPRNEEEKSQTPYTKEHLFIRVDNGLNVRTEFYAEDPDSKKERLEKVMTLNGIRKEGQRWVVEKVEMKNQVTGHMTVIELEKRGKLNEKDGDVFSTDFLASEKGV